MPRSVSVGVLVIGVVAIIVIAAVISANISYRLELEPPGQYNHPYAGRVDERVMPVAEVRALCRPVGASGRFVGCAWVSNGICHIILPNDEPAPVATYRRHEIAHCNGWPASHPHDE